MGYGIGNRADCEETGMARVGSDEGSLSCPGGVGSKRPLGRNRDGLA